MKVSVMGPVLNEADFIGYSIMAVLPHVHEFIYSLDAKSDDGTRELLHHIKDKYAHEKLRIIETPTFHPSNMKAYNDSFRIDLATGDAVFFLHPDMVVTKWSDIKEGPLAWWTQITSYAGDLKTQIVKGRAARWKNIHAKKFNLTYFGGYGSQNEDFYHKDITGTTLKHYGEEFSKYPYEVAPSGITINHYCELKDYARRLEKMKFCLKTQLPTTDDATIEEMAVNHPRVTLESSSTRFGQFEFEPSKEEIPEVFKKYEVEFSPYMKEKVLV